MHHIRYYSLVKSAKRQPTVTELKVNLWTAFSGAVAVAGSGKWHWFETARRTECKVSSCNRSYKTHY